MSASPVILAFDTSGPWCTACVLVGDEVLAQTHHDMARGQGEALLEIVSKTISDAGLSVQDLNAIGVGIGPGNFTGIRISVAAARGLALGLGIPAIGVDRFEALGLEGPDLPIVVPAIRSQVWVRHASEAPVQTDAPPAEAIGTTVEPAFPLAEAIARIAAARFDSPQPRPAPLYLREADAAPSSQTPPRLIE